MAARPVWSGFLKVSLVTVPVKAYTATDSSGEVHLNQLHAECKSRIQLKKTCPIHGAVTDDQIISGHEYEKVKYVTIQPEDLDKLRTPADKMVSIDAFVSRTPSTRFYLGGNVYSQAPKQVVTYCLAPSSGQSVSAIAKGGGIALPVLSRFVSGQRDLPLRTADTVARYSH